MGIRYYAYAFEADRTEGALADPRSMIGGDPLADAWGMPPGSRTAVASFVQSVPEQDMLYLDKAWSPLQGMTAPREPGEDPRPAFRMFEGQVTMDGYGWIPWYRALAPDETERIANDLVEFRLEESDGLSQDDEGRYILTFLDRAVEFVTGVARSNRGFAYMIG